MNTSMTGFRWFSKGVGFSSESTRRELSNKYQHDRVKMVLKKRWVLI